MLPRGRRLGEPKRAPLLARQITARQIEELVVAEAESRLDRSEIRLFGPVHDPVADDATHLSTEEYTEGFRAASHELAVLYPEEYGQLPQRFGFLVVQAVVREKRTGDENHEIETLCSKRLSFRRWRRRNDRIVARPIERAFDETIDDLAESSRRSLVEREPREYVACRRRDHAWSIGALGVGSAGCNDTVFTAVIANVCRYSRASGSRTNSTEPCAV